MNCEDHGLDEYTLGSGMCGPNGTRPICQSKRGSIQQYLPRQPGRNAWIRDGADTFPVPQVQISIQGIRQPQDGT